MTVEEYLKPYHLAYKDPSDRDSYSSYREGYSDAMDIAGQVIEQAQKEAIEIAFKEAKKWNKIEDGLPEKGVKCIVKMENGDHHISERVDLWSGQKHPVPQGVKQKQYWLGMFHMQDEIKYWREI